jgi:3-hydroxyacyl-CoA dehydrogenase/enoyl-CoA hydratase/3-hydroxybutyryl-CoA epimerase
MRSSTPPNDDDDDDAMQGSPLEDSTVGVIGAGMMGSGIAYACAQAGAHVVVSARSEDRAQRAIGYIASRELQAQERGKTTAASTSELLSRLCPTSGVNNLAASSFVIEAVSESVAAKQQVLRDVESVVAPETVLASTTSTLPISAIASALARPGNFIGMHFFSPAERMPLVEVVNGERTSSETLKRALLFTANIAKVPIVVRDSRGFFTTRVIDRYFDEALTAVGEGVDPAVVEQAALVAGYPVAPLQLLDELTLTLNRAVRRETKAAVEAANGTWTAHRADAVRDAMIDDCDRRGRSTGGGFYDYDSTGKRVQLWEGLRDVFGRGEPIPIQDMSDRLLYIEVLEALQCLEEGVIRSAEDADTGSVLGIGFPAQSGGVISFVNTVAGGPREFASRADALARCYGDRFRPPKPTQLEVHIRG